MESELSWLDSNQVISIKIDGGANCRKGKIVKKDTHIMVLYSSGNRLDVSDTLKGWDTDAPTAFAEKLRSRGLTNIESVEIPTSDSKTIIRRLI